MHMQKFWIEMLNKNVSTGLVQMQNVIPKWNSGQIFHILEKKAKQGGTVIKG